MTEESLKQRLKEFALRIMHLCDHLPNTQAGRIVAGQLIRSSTSAGANYRAACRGRSPADFVAKLAIAEEEIDESAYWLDLIISRPLFKPVRVRPLYVEADELTRILTASRITAKRNHQKAPIENRKSKIENPPGRSP